MAGDSDGADIFDARRVQRLWKGTSQIRDVISRDKSRRKDEDRV